MKTFRYKPTIILNLEQQYKLGNLVKVDCS